MHTKLQRSVIAKLTERQTNGLFLILPITNPNTNPNPNPDSNFCDSGPLSWRAVSNYQCIQRGLLVQGCDNYRKLTLTLTLNLTLTLAHNWAVYGVSLCYTCIYVYEFTSMHSRHFGYLNPNSLPEIVISAATTDTFKRRLDKVSQHQDILYDYKVELTGVGVGNRSQINTDDNIVL